jgi:primosomal protein N' (replication factor Y)
VSLTYHRARGVLLCHHCGHVRPSADACAKCGAGPLQSFSDGTEHIEADVAELFPDARVARLDRDTTARKGAQRQILEAWHRGELDILIGTQMVTKGHDVPGVTLVGVLLADLALNMPDFRAAERTFQLLTQVAGRAGRGPLPGTVLVQTFRPQHHALRAAAAHDYEPFARRELDERRELGYPPFARLVLIRLEAEDANAAQGAAEEVGRRAREHAAETVVVRGPAPAPLERLRGRYRWHVMLASPHARALHQVVRAAVEGARTTRLLRGVRLVVDVDPVGML